jgi:hypothetical protein
MAIAVENPLLVKRRAFTTDMSHASNRKLKTFFETHAQVANNINLLLVPFAELTSTETVIAAEAAKLYALFLKKDTATLTFSKITDHATTSSDTAAEFVFSVARIGDEFFSWPAGYALANGLTMQGNTTADGGTGSASNGAQGWAIIGTP